MIDCKKPKQIALIAVLAGLMALASTPALAVWPTSAGGSGDDTATATVVGPTGAVFVTGSFSGEAVFGDGVTISARGPEDIFVARYSSAGTLDWVRRAGGSLGDRAKDIAIDEAGNVYITGRFAGQADFGSTELSSASLDTDVFVAKLDSDGGWQWAHSANGDYSDGATSLVILPGDISAIPPKPATAVIGGYYRCRLEFSTPPSGPFEGFEETLVNTNGNANPGGCSGDDRPERYFLAAIDADGKWQWVKGQPEQGDGFGIESRITDLDISESGAVAALADAELQSGNFFITGNWSISGGFFSIPNTPGAASNELQLNEDFDLTGTSNPEMTLTHGWDLDQPTSCWDIAVVDYSTDQGDSWNRVNPSWISGAGFNGEQNGFENNPVTGPGWCGASFAFNGVVAPLPVSSTIDLSSLGGEDSVRFRWVLGEGDAIGRHGWDIYDLSIADDGGSLFGGIQESNLSVVGRLANIESGEPSWSWTKEAPEGLRLEALRFGPLVDEAIYVVGEASGDVELPEGDNSLNTAGAAVARLSAFQGDFKWARSYIGGMARDIAVDGDDLFIAGDFTNSVTFFDNDPDGTLDSDGERDLFLAKVENVGGAVEWATGGNYYNDDDGRPARAGGTGDAELSGLAFDGLNNLYLAGSFDGQLVFGEDAELFSASGRDVFLANLTTLGGFFEVQGWPVGEAIPPPADADLSSQNTAPDIYIDGELVSDAVGTRFFWNAVPGQDAKLFPLDVVPNVEIHWRVDGEPLESEARIIEVGQTSWPTEPCSDGNDQECYQVHVAGAPTELDEGGTGFRFLSEFNPSFQSSGAEVESGVFNADTPGFSVLLYVEGATPDPQQNPVAVEVVRTMPPALSPNYSRGVRWTIGEPIIEPFHNQPGRTGYVLNENAFYDGVGEDAAYDRAARTGHIIPVNRTRPARVQDAGKAMVVAWYRRNAKGVYWPRRAIEYAPDWPLDPERIIIASQQGAENLGQAPLGPTQFPDLRIYQQPVPGEPGYNPNATLLRPVEYRLGHPGAVRAARGLRHQPARRPGLGHRPLCSGEVF